MRLVDVLAMAAAVMVPLIMAAALRRRRREARAIQEKLDQILERLDAIESRKP
jgi:hypothetical protein